MLDAPKKITSLELFENLRSITHPPSEETFQAIVAQRADITPLLLDELTSFSRDLNYVNQFGDDYIRHIVTIFILAHWREQKAYPLLITLISRSGDKLIKLTGEVFIEALGRILASCYDGNLEPMKEVIENQHLNSWIRAGALDGFMVLWKEGVLTRTEVMTYLRELLETKLERRASYVWDTIALIAYDLHPSDLENLLREAINEKLIAPMVLDESTLNQCLQEDFLTMIKNKQQIVDGFIKAPINELTWWLYPDEAVLEKGLEYAALAVPLTDKKTIPGERGVPIGWRSDTVVRLNEKIGRNDPCFCGSGKKYKKCCGFYS